MTLIDNTPRLSNQPSKCRDGAGMSSPLPYLRRVVPSAALIPHAGQRTLAYVPAEQTDIRKRIHEFNRSVAAHLI